MCNHFTTPGTHPLAPVLLCSLQPMLYGGNEETSEQFRVVNLISVLGIRFYVTIEMTSLLGG